MPGLRLVHNYFHPHQSVSPSVGCAVSSSLLLLSDLVIIFFNFCIDDPASTVSVSTASSLLSNYEDTYLFTLLVLSWQPSSFSFSVKKNKKTQTKPRHKTPNQNKNTKNPKTNNYKTICRHRKEIQAMTFHRHT